MWIDLKTAKRNTMMAIKDERLAENQLIDYFENGQLSIQGFVKEDHPGPQFEEMTVGAHGLLIAPPDLRDVLPHVVDPRSFISCDEIDFEKGRARFRQIEMIGLHVDDVSLRDLLHDERKDVVVRRERLQKELEKFFANVATITRGDLKNRIHELQAKPGLLKLSIPKLDLDRSQIYDVIDEIIRHSPILASKVIN